MKSTADSYRALLATHDTGSCALVGESDLFANDPALVSELLWQSRWFSGDFGDAFTGTAGERIVVRDFGYWNRAAGPDFVESVVEIDGTTRAGAIELDMDARDWERHGHATNPNYENVVLHLFFKQPANQFFTRTPAHRQVTQVVLTPPSHSGTGTGPPIPGRCASVLSSLSGEAAAAFLRTAAHFRAEEKSRQLLRVASYHGHNQAWFQAVAEALGYHANRDAMRMLAQRVPLRLLAARPNAAEALLFGHAGFLDGQPYDETSDPEVRRYLRGLWTTWWKHREVGAPVPPWNFSGLRPANHPHRRVAVLAMLARAWPQLQALLDAANPSALESFFAGLRHPFWSNHFTLNASQLPNAVALVGNERIVDLLGNLVLPVRARQDPAVWSLYDGLPAAAPSRTVMRAADLLLAGRNDRTALLRKFSHQQGLLQIHRDFCQRDMSACRDCPLPHQLARGTNSANP